MNMTSQGLEAQSHVFAGSSLSNTWTHDEVRDELSRILRSRFFIKSTRLSSFLSTAVEYLLAGKADCFKEYTVGTEVYGRSSTYDPTQDTIVRTEARRLRSKLKDYYSDLAGQYRLRITVLTGSYVPVIEFGHTSRYDDEFGTARSATLPSGAKSLSLAVISFNAKVLEPGNQDIANNLEEELTHELAQNPDIKVFRTSVDGREASEGQLCHWSTSGVQFALRGYVRQADNGPIAQIQLTTIQGLILWSERFSGESLQSQSIDIASAVCTAFLTYAVLRARSRYDMPAFNN
jgi:TolB-like protein